MSTVRRCGRLGIVRSAAAAARSASASDRRGPRFRGDGRGPARRAGRFVRRGITSGRRDGWFIRGDCFWTPREGGQSHFRRTKMGTVPSFGRSRRGGAQGGIAVEGLIEAGRAGQLEEIVDSAEVEHGLAIGAEAGERDRRPARQGIHAGLAEGGEQVLREAASPCAFRTTSGTPVP